MFLIRFTSCSWGSSTAIFMIAFIPAKKRLHFRRCYKKIVYFVVLILDLIFMSMISQFTDIFTRTFIFHPFLTTRISDNTFLARFSEIWWWSVHNQDYVGCVAGNLLHDHFVFVIFLNCTIRSFTFVVAHSKVSPQAFTNRLKQNNKKLETVFIFKLKSVIFSFILSYLLMH